MNIKEEEEVRLVVFWSIRRMEKNRYIAIGTDRGPRRSEGELFKEMPRASNESSLTHNSTPPESDENLKFVFTLARKG